MSKCINLVVFDYVSLGNHEFDQIIPKTELQQRLIEIGSDVINTNIDASYLSTTKRFIKRKINVNGLKIPFLFMGF
jgi:2',3'-cyclic-nucleotide 2'-phosphodiesterase (5'-nucleotidase family)